MKRILGLLDEEIPNLLHLMVYVLIVVLLKNIFTTTIKAKVNINAKANGKGRIEIEYYSEEELERLYDMIMSIHHQ